MAGIVAFAGLVIGCIGAFITGNATFADRAMFGIRIAIVGVIIAFFGLAGVVFG